MRIRMNSWVCVNEFICVLKLNKIQHLKSCHAVFFVFSFINFALRVLNKRVHLVLRDSRKCFDKSRLFGTVFHEFMNS